MGLFDINFLSKIVELSPPNKRYAVNIGFLRAFIYPMQLLQIRILNWYRTGYPYHSHFFPGFPYAEGAITISKQAVYISKVDNNMDTPPSVNWDVYLPSFIGVDERIKFNGTRLVLEFALNHRFGGIFRQPTTELYPHVSDIYCNRLGFVAVGFNVGQTIGSSVGQSTSSSTVGYSYPLLQVNNFNINIPNALYLSVSDSEIRIFVDSIIPKGINYTITPY